MTEAKLSLATSDQLPCEPPARPLNDAEPLVGPENPPAADRALGEGRPPKSRGEQRPKKKKPRGQRRGKVASLYTRSQLRGLATAAVCALCLLFGWALLADVRVDSQSVRFLFCLLVSLLSAVFFFVVWPAHCEARLPLTHATVTTVGPFAMFFVTFAVLLRAAPLDDAFGKLYSVVKGNRPIPYHTETTLVRRDNGKPIDFELIQDPANSGWLKAIYVHFGPGETIIPATLHIPSCKNDVSVDLKRDESWIDLSSLE